MKYLVASVVFIMLFVLPLGSWYYLQTGLNYRKEALKELEPKDPIDGGMIFNAKLNQKTSLIVIEDYEEEALKKIYNQYHDSYSFQFITKQNPMIEAENWMKLETNPLEILRQNYPGTGMILTDTIRRLRSIYPNTPEGLTKAIEHVAIALPRVKEVDIKMKGHERK